MLNELSSDSICRRTEWFQENRNDFDFISGNLLDSGYRLLPEQFHVSSDKAPVIKRTDKEIFFIQ